MVSKQILLGFLVTITMTNQSIALGRWSKLAAAWCAVVAAAQGAEGAAEVLNSSNAECPLPENSAPELSSSTDFFKDSPPFFQAVTYFDGENCAVRCVGEADWLGPLDMVCYDAVGCSGMYMQGAQECRVNPEYVAQFECDIIKNGNVTLPAGNESLPVANPFDVKNTLKRRRK